MQKAAMGNKLPKVIGGTPNDATRSIVTSAAPPDTSIYSNPVTMQTEQRTPVTAQVGMSPGSTITTSNATPIKSSIIPDA